MINFDKLAKEIGPVIHSPDALGFTNENIHFIEFKNIKWKNLDIQDCLAKFYQGLSSFAYHSEDFITKNINITYTIICSPNKNLINADNNPLGEVFNESLEKAGNPITDEDRTKHKLSKIKTLLCPLKKYGINVEVNAFLSQSNIDTYISNFTTNFTKR